MSNRHTEVVILVCRLGCGFGWNNEFIVERCSHRRIPGGIRCSEAIERLLNAGFRLISTESIDCGQVVCTFVRHHHRPRPRREAPTVTEPEENHIQC